MYLFRSRDSAVGIVIDYRLCDPGVGVRVPIGSLIFSGSYRLDLGPTEPPTYWVLGSLSPAVKRAGA
jgi:hypothetical protein